MMNLKDFENWLADDLTITIEAKKLVISKVVEYNKSKAVEGKIIKSKILKDAVS